MTVYINVKEDHNVETVDEFETREEAKKMLAEYHMVGGYFRDAYLSNRPTKEWRER